MGIISRTFNKFFNKTEELTEPEPRELAILSPQSQTKIPEFTMPQGEKLSIEEQIEENKYMIRQLDPKLVFITDMINELNSEEDALQVIAEEPDMMRLWLAHVVYKENINNFYTLICTDGACSGYTINQYTSTLSPLSITTGVTNTWTFYDTLDLYGVTGLEIKDDNTLLLGGSSVYQLNLSGSTYTNNTNRNVTICPSQLSESRNMGTHTINPGDAVLIEWNDVYFEP
jgi:hypothetical protein